MEYLADRFWKWRDTVVDDDYKETLCEYWSVYYSPDTNSRRYENGNGGFCFMVRVKPEFIIKNR